MKHTSVNLAGQELDGIDRYGQWKVTGLSGWWESPDQRTDVEDRPRSDGAHGSPVFFEPRKVQIRGRVKSPSHEVQHEAMNRLTGLLGAGSGRLTVAGHGPTQWATVEGTVSVEPVTDRYMRFTLTLTARDPRKYGEYREFVLNDGAADVWHRGNYGAVPRIRVAGSSPDGYTLNVGGKGFRVTRPLVSASHEIEYRTGRLYVGGQLTFGGIQVSNVTTIPPGPGTFVRASYPNGGKPAVRVMLYDTYI